MPEQIDSSLNGKWVLYRPRRCGHILAQIYMVGVDWIAVTECGIRQDCKLFDATVIDGWGRYKQCERCRSWMYGFGVGGFSGWGLVMPA